MLRLKFLQSISALPERQHGDHLLLLFHPFRHFPLECIKYHIHSEQRFWLTWCNICKVYHFQETAKHSLLRFAPDFFANIFLSCYIILLWIWLLYIESRVKSPQMSIWELKLLNSMTKVEWATSPSTTQMACATNLVFSEKMKPLWMSIWQ